MAFKKIIRKFLSGLLLLGKGSQKFIDFIMWPLALRLLGKNYTEMVEIGKEIKMNVYFDMFDRSNKILMFYSRFIPFAWEPVTVRLFIHLLEKKRCVVIGGANLGYYALIAATLNLDATVYAFEPVKEIFTRFSRNIELNKLHNIIPFQLALSNKKGFENITVDNAQSTLIIEEGQNRKVEKVETVRLDDVFKMVDIKPDLLLLDIEGYESFALAGAGSLLHEKNLDIIFEVCQKSLLKAGIKLSDLTNQLTTVGYKFFVIMDDYTVAQVTSLCKNYTVDLVEFTADFIEKHPTFTWFNILATKNDLVIERFCYKK